MLEHIESCSPQPIRVTVLAPSQACPRERTVPVERSRRDTEASMNNAYRIHHYFKVRQVSLLQLRYQLHIGGCKEQLHINAIIALHPLLHRSQAFHRDEAGGFRSETQQRRSLFEVNGAWERHR